MRNRPQGKVTAPTEDGMRQAEVADREDDAPESAADLPAWGAESEAVLGRLVDIAAGRCEDARRGATSLQEKLRATATLAAVVIGLVANAALRPGAGRVATCCDRAILGVGFTCLVLSLIAATVGFRPLNEPGLGSLIVWRGSLIKQGATRTMANLVAGYEDVLELWQRQLSLCALCAGCAQWLLAIGLGLLAFVAVRTIGL